MICSKRDINFITKIGSFYKSKNPSASKRNEGLDIQCSFELNGGGTLIIRGF